MKQPTLREQHLSADNDSLRADCERLAKIITDERNRAQVVLSQKGTLEIVNADLLKALKRSAEKLHDLRDEPECMLHTFDNCPRSYCVEARDDIKKAKKR